MKNISLAFNIILTIAVGILFWLHFKGSKGGEPTRQINFGDKNMKIAYVNVEKIDSNYKYITDKRAIMEKEVEISRNSLASAEQSLSGEQQKLQKEAYDLENNSSISMTDKYNKQKELQVRYDKFQQDYAIYQQRKDAMEKDLDIKIQDFNKNMMESLNNNIKKYNLNQQYDYILTKQQMLFANDSLDITQDILQLLNEEYETTK
ncbi:MAG: OmpH family outer membrane protein [Bacteroidetes bacterium]|nr:OmpH family outer membrane protein [Bacteroidota bacterium]